MEKPVEGVIIAAILAAVLVAIPVICVLEIIITKKLKYRKANKKEKNNV